MGSSGSAGSTFHSNLHICLSRGFLLQMIHWGISQQMHRAPMGCFLQQHPSVTVPHRSSLPKPHTASSAQCQHPWELDTKILMGCCLAITAMFPNIPSWLSHPGGLRPSPKIYQRLQHCPWSMQLGVLPIGETAFWNSSKPLIVDFLKSLRHPEIAAVRHKEGHRGQK